MAQGALGAAGVRRVWAGAGLQRAAYRGRGHIVRPRAQLVTSAKEVMFLASVGLSVSRITQTVVDEF